MTPATETVTPSNLMVDCRANLIIVHGDTRIVMSPTAALDLIKFLERTGYQAHANTLVKGAAQ